MDKVKERIGRRKREEESRQEVEEGRENEN